MDFRLRGISSKTIGPYDHLHLNVNTETKDGDRSVLPGLILGYSRPLGYPRLFDRTILAEVGVRGGEEKVSRQARSMDNSAAFSLNSCSTSEAELSS